MKTETTPRTKKTAVKTARNPRPAKKAAIPVKTTAPRPKADRKPRTTLKVVKTAPRADSGHRYEGSEKPTKVMMIRTLKAGNVRSTEKEENAKNYEEAKFIRDAWGDALKGATRLKKAKFYLKFELPDSFVSIRIFRHREPRKKNAA